MIVYRGYRITYEAKPIEFPYEYMAEDYGGLPDKRCGIGASVDDCKAQIDELEDES